MSLLNDDLDVFFDLDEFAEMHNINGQNMVCIIDQHISKQYRMNYDGLFMRQVVLFVRESDLGYRPDYDQRMTIDDKWYTVMECVNNNGLLEITLGANMA
ncbi:hypothetical protein SCACP_21400 [Sporomusa carbonis]|uniref:hypothetical protein n=1 Tax=Sporomusa carbonis TaxID=3076075 RepID=UPI003A702B4F